MNQTINKMDLQEKQWNKIGNAMSYRWLSYKCIMKEEFKNGRYIK